MINKVVERSFISTWPEPFRVLLVAIAAYGFVAGGYPRYLLAENAPEPEDIDLFFYQPEYIDYVEKILQAMNYQKLSETRAALTYCIRGDADALPVQLVKPAGQSAMRGRTGTVTEVLSTFDFSVNQFALASTRSGVITQTVGEHTWSDQTHLRLRIVDNSHPLALIYRMMKYTKKGYYTPRSEAARLFIGWDATSPRLKNWVHEEMTRIEDDTYSQEEEADSFELLHALTDGLIGEKELFEHV